jgi:prolipoprotein diacylglyceryltransferase
LPTSSSSVSRAGQEDRGRRERDDHRGDRGTDRRPSLHHVIDQWVSLQDDLLKIVLPPYTGLGVYGGIAIGLIAVVVYTRIKGLPFWRWADVIAPALFAMQAVARWGNFFNQELYGPPTTLPWGIPIDCAHRVAAYACPPGSDPSAVLAERFIPVPV